MRLLSLLVLGVVGLAMPTLAAPMDDALRSELLGVYDRYNKAVLANKWNDAAALRDAKTRADIQAELKKAKGGKTPLLEMAKDMVPDKVEPQHTSLNRDGTKANIITLASKTMPKGVRVPGAPPAGTVIQSEITLEFAREGHAWKFVTQTFGMDPNRIKSCKADDVEKQDDYDDGRNLNFGGQIRRVEFKPDHTLLVIRVLDEENCAILPTKAVLIGQGMNPDVLVPYAVVEMEGSPHRTDKQRAMVTGLRVLSED